MGICGRYEILAVPIAHRDATREAGRFDSGQRSDAGNRIVKELRLLFGSLALLIRKIVLPRIPAFNLPDDSEHSTSNDETAAEIHHIEMVSLHRYEAFTERGWSFALLDVWESSDLQRSLVCHESARPERRGLWWRVAGARARPWLRAD